MKNLKTPISCIFFFLAAHFLQAQYFSGTLDALSKAQLMEFGPEEKQVFIRMIIQRNEHDLYQRIDSIGADYVFIEESYRTDNGSYDLKERHYFKADSSSLLFHNGKAVTYTGGNQYGFYGSGLVAQCPVFDYWPLKDVQAFFERAQDSAKAVNALVFSPDTWIESQEKLREMENALRDQFNYLYKSYAYIDEKQSAAQRLQLPNKNLYLPLYNDILLSPHGW